jgi:hypothetical protein
MVGDIYGPYNNGTNNVYGDPLRITRRLDQKLQGNHDKWAERTYSTRVEEKAEALGKLAEAAVFAFELVPFDPKSGRGCTEQVAINVLQAFNEWRKEKKENARNSVTSSQPTVPGENPPQKRSMVSTSTETGSGFEHLT